jgi:hypothetical protein
MNSNISIDFSATSIYLSSIATSLVALASASVISNISAYTLGSSREDCCNRNVYLLLVGVNRNASSILKLMVQLNLSYVRLVVSRIRMRIVLEYVFSIHTIGACRNRNHLVLHLFLQDWIPM